MYDNDGEIIEPGYYNTRLSRGKRYELDGCIAVATMESAQPEFEAWDAPEMEFGATPVAKPRAVLAHEADLYCACCDDVDVPYLCSICMHAELEAETRALSPEYPGVGLGY